MEHSLIDAATAAQALGVTRSTLYSYVSRGLLASHRHSDDRRSWFDPGEVERLRRRGRSRGGSGAGRPGGGALDIRSAVTLIADGRYWYRGHDPLTLADTASFEQVAELLWSGALPDAATTWPVPAGLGSLQADLRTTLGPDATSTDLLRVAVAALAARDPLRTVLEASAVVHVGRRLLPALVGLLAADGVDHGRDATARRDTMASARAAQPDGSPAAAAATAGGPASPPLLAHALWEALTTGAPPQGAIEALQAAMILLADHELAASTSAVRIAASFPGRPLRSGERRSRRVEWRVPRSRQRPGRTIPGRGRGQR